MNWKKWAPLAIAIVLGGIAAKLTRDMMARNQGAHQQPRNTIGVVVAKQDLAPGTELTPEMLILTQLSPAAAPERAFSRTDDLVGRVTEIELVKGQAIVEPMLAEAGAGSGLQALIPTGMRAITIEVNEFSGLAGMITPGCRVDVVATLRADSGEAQVARTIVENVKVTAVGQRVVASGSVDPAGKPQGAAEEPAKSVTLLATPEQAEAIELASAAGRPRLVLRGGRDNQPGNTVGITLAELLGTAVAPAPIPVVQSDPFAQAPAPATRPSAEPSHEPSAPLRRSVQVIRAGLESSVTIEEPGRIRPATVARETPDAGGHDALTQTPLEVE